MLPTTWTLDIADDVQKLVKARLGQMLRPDVGGVVVGRLVVGRDRPVGDKLADTEVTQSYVLCARAVRPVPERLKTFLICFARASSRFHFRSHTEVRVAKP